MAKVCRNFLVAEDTEEQVVSLFVADFADGFGQLFWQDINQSSSSPRRTGRGGVNNCHMHVFAIGRTRRHHPDGSE